jgi:hypothetical protein
VRPDSNSLFSSIPRDRLLLAGPLLSSRDRDPRIRERKVRWEDAAASLERERAGGGGAPVVPVVIAVERGDERSWWYKRGVVEEGRRSLRGVRREREDQLVERAEKGEVGW